MDTGSVRSLEVIVADFMRFTLTGVKRAIRRMVKMPGCVRRRALAG